MKMDRGKGAPGPGAPGCTYFGPGGTWGGRDTPGLELPQDIHSAFVPAPSQCSRMSCKGGIS